MNTHLPENPHELISYVADKLLKQGRKATNPYGQCCYETTDGRRCALGWISEHPRAVILDRVREKLKWSPEVKLLEDLRRIHDHHLPNEWPAEFETLLSQYPKTAGEDATAMPVPAPIP